MKIKYKIKPSIVNEGVILYYVEGSGGIDMIVECCYKIDEIRNNGTVMLRNSMNQVIPHIRKDSGEWKTKWRLATLEEQAAFTQRLYSSL